MAVNKSIAAALCAVLCGSAAAAQSAGVPIGRATGAMLKWGTPIALATTGEIDASDAAAGRRVDLAVAEDVVVDGRVVIARGSPAVAEVSAVNPHGEGRRDGRLRVRLLAVRGGGRPVRIAGAAARPEDDGTPGTVAVVAFGGAPGGFLAAGTGAVPSGTGLNAYVDEDVRLVFAAGPSRPTADAR